MIRLLKFIFLLATAAALLSPPVDAGNKSIYGDDDRLEYFEAAPAVKQLADSVVSLWRSQDVRYNDANHELATVGFGDSSHLCPGEQFREQPRGAYCSGTLVGEDIIMTAGHCIWGEVKCADTKFVFGFNIPKIDGQAHRSIKAEDIYGCKRIIKIDMDGPNSTKENLHKAGPDYALVQLDRKVKGRHPLPINRSKDLRAGDPVFTIGHPLGLPLKVAGGAKVRDNSLNAFFTTNLDAFSGNSGSAVFNTRTKQIEGILSGGDPNAVGSPAKCITLMRYEQNGGWGMAATKISILEGYIPEPRTSAPLAATGVIGMAVEELPLPDNDLAERIHF